MAGTHRKTANDIAQLTSRLAERPYEYGFYSVLRLFECLYGEKPRLGASQRPIEDHLAF